MGRRIIVYPGSFDPVTNGHLDLIERGLKICDHLIVAVVKNPNKTSTFSLNERLQMLKDTVDVTSGSIEVDIFTGLLTDYVRSKNANVILRGLRAVSDFEYEFEMALTNRRLYGEIDTVFMAPSEEYIFLRASMVKEIAQLGGDISSFVPSYVEQRLKQLYQKIR